MEDKYNTVSGISNEILNILFSQLSLDNDMQAEYYQSIKTRTNER